MSIHQTDLPSTTSSGRFRAVRAGHGFHLAVSVRPAVQALHGGIAHIRILLQVVAARALARAEGVLAPGEAWVQSVVERPEDKAEHEELWCTIRIFI